MEAVKKVGQLQAMLVDQNEKENEIKNLKAKLKASKLSVILNRLDFVKEMYNVFDLAIK